MTYIIAEPCIDVRDKSCVDVCPVDCIHPTDGEGEPILYIDPDECIDCGACEPECPVEAIFAEEDLPEEWSRFTEINAKYFELKDSPEHTYSPVKESDFPAILERFEEGVARSTIGPKIHVDTSTASPDETLDEIVEALQPHLTDFDRERIEVHGS